MLLACSSYNFIGAMAFLQPYVKSELKDSYLTAWRSGNAACLNLDVPDGNFNRGAAILIGGF
jgi:hypothetical protein